MTGGIWPTPIGMPEYRFPRPDDAISEVLQAHRVDEDADYDLTCTCGQAFYPNAGPGGLTWHERHLAVELRLALGLDPAPGWPVEVQR